MEARIRPNKKTNSFSLTENSAHLRAFNSKSGPAVISSFVYDEARSKVVVTGYINEAKMATE